MLTVDHAKSVFKRVFWRDSQIVIRSPGRVELIGGHTDYNDGFVLPMAIEKCCYVAAAPRSDRQVRVYSELFDQDCVFALDVNLAPGQPKWANYCKGVAALLLRAGRPLVGLDLAVVCDIPVGGGLSSSAAIEVGFAKAFLAGCDDQMPAVEMALLCREAEHTFAGAPCGIMDQFICCLARKDHALFLDCRSREYRHVPFPHDRVSLIVADTKVKHELGASEYPLRQQQCRQAVSRLVDHGERVSALRDVTQQMLDRYAQHMDKMLLARARHVVGENHRVQQTAGALEQSDLQLAGDMMNQSHRSLSQDYQVSCEELDFLADCARNLPDVYGARMSGGGFGGCVVILARPGSEQAIEQELTRRYTERFDRQCSVFHTTATGAAEVLLS